MIDPDDAPTVGHPTSDEADAAHGAADAEAGLDEDSSRTARWRAAEVAGRRALAGRMGPTVPNMPAASAAAAAVAAAATRAGVPEVALATPEVFWWATATAAQIDKAMRELAYFTEWLVATYDLSPTLVPACWPLHPGLVQELWALRLIHAANHQPGPSGLPGPITFSATFAAWRERVRATLPDLDSCRGGHRPAPGNPQQVQRREHYPPTSGDFRWNWPDIPIDPAPPRSAL